MENKYIHFLDSIGRTVLATLVEQTDVVTKVTNPVVLQVLTDQQNKVKIQLVPILFRDIQKNPEENPIWSFNNTQITVTSLSSLNDRFVSQYEFVVGLTPEKAAKLSEEKKAAQTPAAPAPVVKLFDEAK